MRSSWNFLPACLPKVPILALLCLLLPLCRAGPAFTNTHYDIVPGVPFELSWAGNEGPVTVELVSVAQKGVAVVQNVTVNNSRSSITWMPPKSVPTGVCLLFRIKDSGGKLDYSRDLDFKKKAASLSSALFTDPAPSPTVDASQLPTARKTSMPTAAAETGLSTGAKVGIGTGVAAVPLLLLAAFLVFLSCRRRRRQQRRRQQQEEQDARSSHHQHHYHFDPAAVRDSKAGSTRTTSSCATTDIASDCSCCSATDAPAPGPAPPPPPPPLTTRMSVLSPATTVTPLRTGGGGGVAVDTPSSGSPLSAVAARGPRGLRARAADGGGYYASVPAAESVDPFEDVISPLTPQLATAPGWKSQQQQQQQLQWPPRLGVGERPAGPGRSTPAGKWAASGQQCQAPLAELETRANVAQVESTGRPWSRRGEAWRRQQAVESPVLGRARLDTPSLYSQDGPGM